MANLCKMSMLECLWSLEICIAVKAADAGMSVDTVGSGDQTPSLLMNCCCHVTGSILPVSEVEVTT